MVMELDYTLKLGLETMLPIESIQLINDPTLGVAAFYAESNGGGPAVLANATNAGPGVHANSKQAAGVRAHTSSQKRCPYRMYS